MDDSMKEPDVLLAVEDATFIEHGTPDISMETHVSKDSPDIQDRKVVKLDMDLRDDTNDDPLDRFARVVDLFHRISPLQALIYCRVTLEHMYRRRKRNIAIVVIWTLVVFYMFYMGLAFRHEFGDEGSVTLLVITLLVMVCVIYHYIKLWYGPSLYTRYGQPIMAPIKRYRRFISCMLSIAVSIAVILFIIIDTTIRRPQSLISAVGMVVIITAMFFFSKDPRQVVWRPVLWGLLLQFLFAIVVLRTTWGYQVFVWLGDKVTVYLSYADAGSTFVFGPTFRDHLLAFAVMPVLIFFSATIGVLYYLGLIQLIIEKIAFIMQFTLGTGAMESLHAAINIFVGWGEAITLIRPVLGTMSLSELHTVMTNGFATVAGSTLAIYILYGAPANHLLSASVMSAPAALAMSKLFYPETRENRRKKSQEYNIPRSGSGIMEAASVGATGAISIVAYILASVIAFFSLLAFVNASLQWFGDRVGLSPPNYPTLSFELICSYLFWPVVFLMGVAPNDCRIVGRLVGMKTFINEILAYEDLGKVRANRIEYERLMATNGGIYNITSLKWDIDGNSNYRVIGTNVTFEGGIISAHSEMIATYALCGFSNVVALGIMIGALTVVAPSRKDHILKVSFRALISGSMACFLTGCIAGLLGDG